MATGATRSTLIGGAAVCALALAAPWSARAQTQTFDLRAQSAVTAIPEFARQARLQIIAPADQLRTVWTPEIRGALDVRLALRRLISGTGLEIAADDGRTITLRRRPAAPPQLLSRAIAGAADRIVTTELDPLVVFGRGEARQVQIVRAGELDRAAPGSSPLALLAKLPGVNTEAAEAFGANEWSARIMVRSFAQGRLGFTLDDVPLGDMTYGNHNGLHISRAITGENLESVELAQGPGSLDAASSSNLGGTIKFTARDPAYESGGYAVLASGSDDTFRGFLRLETGELPDGLRASASYVYNTTDKWQGAGRQYVEQVNFRAARPLGEGALTGFLNLSRRRESDPQDLSLEMIRRLGLGWDNVSTDWDLAVRLAEIGHNRGETGVTPRNPAFGVDYPAPIADVDDAYYDSTTARDDALAAVTFRWPAGERLALKSTVYGHWNKGQGLWWTPYVASPNYGIAGATTDDAPLSIRATEYDIRRRGVIGSATSLVGAHKVTAGLWLEENDFVQARRFYGLDRAAPQRSYKDLQRDPFLTEWVYHFTTRTRQFHLQDVWSPTPELAISAGFKSLTVTNHVATLAGPEKSGAIRARNHFLPQAGFRYRLAPDSEVFGDYAHGMRAFPASNTSGPFATTEEAFQTIREKLKPEISDGVELGWRGRAEDVTLLAAVYGVRFRNRLVSTPVGQGIVGNPPALANASSVTAYGLEAAASWRPSASWSVFGSYAFNRAAYDRDVFDGDGVLIARTKDKNPVETPEHMLKARLDYQRGGFFAGLGATYLSKRFFSFENDQHVDGRVVADLAVGYEFSGSPWLDGLQAQVNVTNLFDARYVSTVGSNDFPIRGDAQTLLAGPPRQVFVAVRKAF